MALIAASSIRSCLGDGPRTFAALLAGRTGVGPLRHPLPGPVNVTAGYHVEEPPPGTPLRASTWLAACVAEVLATSGLDPAHHRVAVIVGTGLRELGAVETGDLTDPDRLHFGPAVRAVAPEVTQVLTVANACSAGGHALALAQDLVEAGDADAVIAAAADTMTTSMLAMIGRVADRPTERVRPFDAARTGVLLGEGAGAVLVTGDDWTGPVAGRLLGTGLSCDASHETAPDPDGIARAMADAYKRTGRDPGEVDLVAAHGTGTALNDPAESAALRRFLPAGGPPVTALKGALGHMSGAAALAGVDVALRSLAAGVVPPIAGLRTPLPEGDGLRFVRDAPLSTPLAVAQVNAFGFGGVNAVTLVAAR
ncbi:beta-ketoacyl synthase [Micromonospora sp. R77]|uniref:beta-ketoacyl synthase N-terminal-like domain-containing protein n=1 Tax=Micromonospora sp. R77 TaxID=2925836 RepID=UPI001F61344E|nr:beta-ketoacyl synthase N-terminal-like domain-containing protein [Micromonospora sp. R77]MCI4066465.1 beta-ketoacyl synthase [Micromonospora sp. R77]